MVINDETLIQFNIFSEKYFTLDVKKHIQKKKLLMIG